MKLSVDNGMFTVSFLKEGLTKVRVMRRRPVTISLVHSSEDGSTIFSRRPGKHVKVPMYWSRVQVL
jgi:hypothetical protein